MKSVGVVVLNYKNYRETFACVESVLQQQNVQLHIAIVENGSQNDSALMLQSRYEGHPQVDVLVEPENLGYARGNNVGISFLRAKGYNYILVANSDVVLTDRDVLQQMLSQYTPQVGMLLPVIHNPDGTVDQRVGYRKKLLPLRLIKACLQTIYWSKRKELPVSSEADSRKSAAVADDYAQRTGLQEDCYLVTGSAFILTPAFFRNYSGIYPETFLYYEECGLMLYLHKAKLLTKVVATTPILHKGAASTADDMRGASLKKRQMGAASAYQILKLIFLSKKRIQRRYI